jgi:hypothetical protein
MLPTKKVQTQNASTNQKKEPEPNNAEEFEEDEELSNQNSSNDESSPRKQRKRRTLSETSKRDFVCGCGKSYVSYPAIYLHVQRKHNGDWPANTVIPEKSDNQDKVKRGRPKKEKHNMLDVNNDIQNEVKYKAEDNFWLFLGTKGNTGNPKLENRFITNLETQPYNPSLIFQHSDLFEDPEVHQDISQILKALSNANGAKNSAKKSVESKSLYETHLSHFILWISNPLKEDIFIELGIIVSLLRLVVLSCIWFDNQKNGVVLKDDSLEIHLGTSSATLKLSKADSSKLDGFVKNGVCPLLGSKWPEIKKAFNGHALLPMITEAKKAKEIETLFYNKLNSFSSPQYTGIDYVVEAMLNLKETELKESFKSKKKFSFLTSNTKEDLKELIQKMCEWLHYFDERELILQDTGLAQ